MPTAPTKTLKIATRGSKLALWQADFIADLFSKQSVSSEKSIIKTQGDKVQDRFLHEIGGKGLFIKELEQSLERGDTDLAIHSLKDMPAKMPAGFCLSTILARHSPADSLIFRDDVAAKLNLGDGPIEPHHLQKFGAITIGTASLRRQALLKMAAPEIKIKGVRGNVDTRLAKLAAGDWDALILAEASLDRLDLKGGLICRRISPDWFIPCAGQGALAIETTVDSPLRSWLQTFECPTTRAQVDAERMVLGRLGGDCTMPCGVNINFSGGHWYGRAGVYDMKGQNAIVDVSLDHSMFTIKTMANELIKKLKAKNVGAILTSLGIDTPKEFVVN
jgi:hydroxymethylbilane synthase